MSTIGVKDGASRDDLLRLCKGERIHGIRSARNIPYPETGMTLVWPTIPASNLPHLVVVPNESARLDLLAWLATYMDAYIPFTAHCRVECPEYLPSAAKESELPGGFQNAAVACVMLETVAANEAGLTVRDCPNTYSYCLARALALGYDSQALMKISSEYERLMRATDQEVRRRQAIRFGAAWQILGAIYGSTGIVRNKQDLPLIRACMELAELGNIGAETLRQLAPNVLGIENVASMPSWTIEDRVTLFSALLESNRPSVDSGAGFVLGYALSLVSSGSLAHLKLAERAERSGIPVIPWYGVCVGLHPDATASQIGEPAVAVRVLREIARPFRLLERPRCDIASREAEMFLQESAENLPGALSGLGSALVELAPGIETGVPLYRRTAKARPKDERERLERQTLIERQMSLANVGEKDPIERIAYHLSEAQLELARLRSPRRK